MMRDDLRGMANVIARRAQLASVLLLGCMSLALAADKAAELSDEFLEYLGSLESDEDNWMEVMASVASAQQAQAGKVNPRTETRRTEARAAGASSSSISSKNTSQAAGVTTGAVSKTDKVEK